jgi:hypothetical protein
MTAAARCLALAPRSRAGLCASAAAAAVTAAAVAAAVAAAAVRQMRQVGGGVKHLDRLSVALSAMRAMVL